MSEEDPKSVDIALIYQKLSFIESFLIKHEKKHEEIEKEIKENDTFRIRTTVLLAVIYVFMTLIIIPLANNYFSKMF